MDIPTKEQIVEIREFFKNITIPEKVIMFNGAIIQNDAPKFIEENLALLENNQLTGMSAAERYYNLCQLKRAILEA